MVTSSPYRRHSHQHPTTTPSARRCNLRWSRTSHACTTTRFISLAGLIQKSRLKYLRAYPQQPQRPPQQRLRRSVLTPDTNAKSPRRQSKSTGSSECVRSYRVGVRTEELASLSGLNYTMAGYGLTTPANLHQWSVTDPQHFLCFFPDPHGHGSLRPTFPPARRCEAGSSSPCGVNQRRAPK
jgi:hypothetical protein